MTVENLNATLADVTYNRDVDLPKLMSLAEGYFLVHEVEALLEVSTMS